jgi:Xaa-Pro dipeptidase
MGFSARLPAHVYAGIGTDLRTNMDAAGLDAVLLDDPLDVAYLTGFVHFPCERPVAVWVGTDRTVLLVPELEREHAQVQDVAAEILTYPEFPGVVPPFAVLAGEVAAGRRAAYASSMSVGRARAVREAFDSTTWSETELVVNLRLRKRPEEIVLHREAARIADDMIRAGLACVVDALAGHGTMPTEAELAGIVGSHGRALMDAEHDHVVVVPMLTGGLVYAGANSAHPHGLPGSYRPQPGDTFMLSLGCAVGGRFVESERTFVIGSPTDLQRRSYEAVREAQEVGTQALRPGTTCAEANQVCLGVLRDAGFAEFIRHRQGHGIGLGFHEPPWVEDGDHTVLEPGMVVSSEPGLYIPGHAGYRISDTVLVGEGGPERLTAYPRALDDVTLTGL